MTYRFTNGPGRWKIDALLPGPRNRWQLCYATNEAWLLLKVFASATEAMVAVGAGRTGVATWDDGPHNPTDFTDDKWSFERW